jgi:phosphoenolpyruvate synthase/pyruvate phosphate dikinase
VFNLYENHSIPTNLVDLHERLSYLFDLECKLLAATLFCESMDHDAAHEMSEFVKIKDIPDFLANATLPAFESFTVWQEELVVQGKQGRWMLADYYGAPSEQEAKKIFEDKLKVTPVDEISKEVDLQKKKVSENKKRVDEYKKSLTGKSLNLFEYIQMSMMLRDRRKEAIQKAVVLIVDALSALASKYSLTYHDLSFVHKDELKKLGDKIFLLEIEKRKEVGAVELAIATGSKVVTTPIEEVKNSIIQIMSNESNEELKGVIAQRGKASGVAKVILNEKDFPLFNKGDVLVTSMTRPEFVPLMRKASAVITDEGGVTCHAAIISRELGLPCIIGTRTATIILKTGDLVEVDAELGIIKIIK